MRKSLIGLVLVTVSLIGSLAEAHRERIVVRDRFGRSHVEFIEVGPSFALAPSFYPAYAPAYYGPNYGASLAPQFYPNVSNGCGGGATSSFSFNYSY